jgi:hypothetical protein
MERVQKHFLILCTLRSIGGARLWGVSCGPRGAPLYLLRHGGHLLGDVVLLLKKS